MANVLESREKAILHLTLREKIWIRGECTVMILAFGCLYPAGGLVVDSLEIRPLQ
jgi:hypothetical protein